MISRLSTSRANTPSAYSAWLIERGLVGRVLASR
jgi:hypothetical protein